MQVAGDAPRAPKIDAHLSPPVSMPKCTTAPKCNIWLKTNKPYTVIGSLGVVLETRPPGLANIAASETHATQYANAATRAGQ